MKIQAVSLQNTEPSTVIYEFLQEISIRFLNQYLPYLLENRQPSHYAQLSDYKGGREKTILTPNLDDLGYLKILPILANFCYILFLYSNSGRKFSLLYVAQLVACRSVDLMVAGSSPAHGRKLFPKF